MNRRRKRERKRKMKKRKRRLKMNRRLLENSHLNNQLNSHLL